MLQSKFGFHLVIISILALLAGGCKPQKPAGPEGQQDIPWKAKVFALLVEDLTGDGLKEIVAIDHGQNMAKIFSQSAVRQFDSGSDYAGVGMHPGNLIRWPGEATSLVLAAEGDADIRALQPGGKAKTLKVVSNLKERAPRYLSSFNWPGWGDSLVVTPYVRGFVVLLKNYDPIQGKWEERIAVPLSLGPAPTIRAAERITVADLNGDGADELLFVVAITNELMQISLTADESGVPKPKASVLYQNPEWGGPNEAQVIDLDGDGDQDLLLADETMPGNINILLNDGKGNLREGKSIKFTYDEGVTELRVARDRDEALYLFAVGYGAVAVYQVPKGWKDGMEMPNRKIEWPAGGLSFDMQLKDIDSDGWLDGIVGKTNGDSAVWVVYGPLWERFQALGEKGFKLK